MKTKFFQKMTGKIPVLVLAAAVLFAGTALAGCNRDTSATEDAEETASAAEGEPESSEGIISRDVSELAAEQKSMLGPMGALIYAYIDEGNETPTWISSGWPAVSELFNYWGVNYVDDNGQVTGDDSGIRISEDFLKEAASAMFPDYDESLPTIDESAEETAGFQPEENGYFPYVFSDRGEGADDFSIASWTEQDDGTCEVTVEATDEQGDTTTYCFTLTPLRNADQLAYPVFYYTVTDMYEIR